MFAPGSGVTFTFKERRADGLGPDIDFSTMDPHMYNEMFGKFATTPYDDVNFLIENALDLTNPMVGLLGFDGFFKGAWCSPALQLAKINTPGNYDVGINLFNPNDPGITLNFPTQFTVAAVVYGTFADGYGIYSPISPAGTLNLHPAKENFNQQGEINLLVLLGSEVANGTHCKTTDMRFTSGTGNSFSVVDNSTQIQSKALQIPAGFTLSNLTMTLNNISISTGEWGLGHLPKDGNGNYMIPIIPGADYEFLIKKSTSQFYTLKYTADEIAAFGGSIIIGEGVFQTTTLNLANFPGSGSLTLTYSGPKGSAQSSFYLNGSETSLSGIPVLSDSTDIEIQWSNHYKKTTVAQINGALDFSNLVGTSLTGLNIIVDETQKTVTVSYNSQTSMALVEVNVNYDLGRSRQFSFITDPLKTSFTFSYPLPAYTYEAHGFPQDCPANDSIQSVSLTVTAMQPTVNYDDALRNMFENLGVPQWSLNNFINGKRIDEYVTVQSAWNKQ